MYSVDVNKFDLFFNTLPVKQSDSSQVKNINKKVNHQRRWEDFPLPIQISLQMVVKRGDSELLYIFIWVSQNKRQYDGFRQILSNETQIACNRRSIH